MLNFVPPVVREEIDMSINIQVTGKTLATRKIQYNFSGSGTEPGKGTHHPAPINKPKKPKKQKKAKYDA